MADFEMPEFVDPDGQRWEWDPTSHEYRVTTDKPKADWSHATGQDADLFDPAVHSEQPGNPVEDFAKAAAVEPECPRCGAPNRGGLESCERCMFPLRKQFEQQERFNTDMAPFDDRDPKPDAGTFDRDGFAIGRVAEALPEIDWGNAFGETPSLGGKEETHRFIVTPHNEVHVGPASMLHEDILANTGAQEKARGSVYANGTAEIHGFTQPGASVNKLELERTLGHYAGKPVQITYMPGMEASDEEGAGNVAHGIPVTGISGGGFAWLKQNGVPPDELAQGIGLIFVAEHAETTDYPAYSKCKGFVTATGGATSHAAIVAKQMNVPCVVGIGAMYSKIQTAAALTIRADGTVEIGSQNPKVLEYAGRSPEQWADAQAQRREILRQYPEWVMPNRGGSVTDDIKFAFDRMSVGEIDAASLDECPECTSPMNDHGDTKICHSCGHKQPILHVEAAVQHESFGLSDITNGVENAAGGAWSFAKAHPWETAGLVGAAAIPGIGWAADAGLLGAGAAGAADGIEAGGLAGNALKGLNVIKNVAPGLGGAAEEGAAPAAEEAAPAAQEAATSASQPGRVRSLMGGAANAGKNFAAMQYFGGMANGLMGGGAGGQQMPDTQGMYASVHTALLDDDHDDPEKSPDLSIENDGDDITEDGTQGSREDHGDNLDETLRDLADTGSGGYDRDQMEALHAFNDNLPTIMYFNFSDDSGKGHPVVDAVQQLIDAAFPEHQLDEHPQDAGGHGDDHDPVAEDEHPKDDESSDVTASTHEATLPQMPQMNPGMGSPMTPTPGGLGQETACPVCGGPMPCPMHSQSMALQQISPGGQTQQARPAQQMLNTPVSSIHEELTKFQAALGDMWNPGASDVQVGEHPVGEHGSIEPHPSLQYYSPDEVAETVDGISPETYHALWDLTNHPEAQKIPMGGEGHDPYGENGPPTVEDPASRMDMLTSGGGNMAALFHHLSPEQQQEINAAMERQEAGWDDPMHAAKTAGDVSPGATPPDEGHHHHPEHGDHQPSAVGGSIESNITDTDGNRLEAGRDYLMHSDQYSIPDDVTVDHIKPNSIVVTMHGNGMDIPNEISLDELTNAGMTFEPKSDATQADFQEADNGVPVGVNDSEAQTGAPGQQDDLSDTPTKASSVEEFNAFLDEHPERNWLWENVKPEEHTAGKAFTQREQSDFIQEAGAARNLNKLDLADTHYVDEADIEVEAFWL